MGATELLNQISVAIDDLCLADIRNASRHFKRIRRALSDPLLFNITESLAQKIDLEFWLQMASETESSFIGSAVFELPEDEEAEFGLIICLINRFASDVNFLQEFVFKFFYDHSIDNGSLEKMIGVIFFPFRRDFTNFVRRNIRDDLPTLAERTVAVNPGQRGKLSDVVPHSMQISLSRPKIFLVHGHDTSARHELALVLERIGADAIVLHERPNAGQTVIEKIESNSDVQFAVVLLTDDDVGGKSADMLLPRARQNVILEMGYFIGLLGRSKVIALKKNDVETPSDFAGIVYITLDEVGAWKYQLARELHHGGFEISPDKLHRI